LGLILPRRNERLFSKEKSDGISTHAPGREFRKFAFKTPNAELRNQDFAFLIIYKPRKLWRLAERIAD
jgi:hypothetical protein